MKLKNILLISTLFIILLCIGISANAAEIVDSGTCGDNVTYTLDSEGLLTISGEGEMYNYIYPGTGGGSSGSVGGGSGSIGGGSSTPIKRVPWYSNLKLIKSVHISDGVVSIGDDSFYNCSNLTELNISNTVKEINRRAFYNCASLLNINIPDEVTSIDSSAFYNTMYYNNYNNWENNVLYIGNHLIAKNCSLTGNYTIKSGTKTISDGFFSGCTELTGITIPNTITNIPSFAFSYCSNLTNITIPDSVTNIGSYAFRNCTSLVNINIPDSVVTIGENTFDGCISLEDIILGKGMTNIPSYIFSGCTNLTNITIPNNIISIESNSFCGCTSLTDINIPNSVTNIEPSSFRGCTNLMRISVDPYNPNYSSQDGALFNKTKTSLRCFPAGIPGIYTIPNSVTNIDSGAFEDCQKLTEISIPPSVTWIGSSAFSNCSNLINIIIPNGVKNISNSTFSNCTNLTSITIPDSVTSIGGYAFSSCDSLTSITIPNSVTTIEWGAFSGCSKLESIIVGANNPSYSSQDGVLFDKEKTTLLYYPNNKCGAYIIPSSITSIKSEAFSMCTGITSVIIPNKITCIEHGTFIGCTNLTDITISNSVTQIRDSAFYRCTNLSNFYYLGTEDDWNHVIIEDANSALLSLTPIYLYTDTQASENKCIFNFCIATHDAASGMLAIAIYNEDNILIGIKTENQTFENGCLELTDYEVGFVGTPHSYEIMILDGLNTFRPITQLNSGLIEL